MQEELCPKTQSYGFVLPEGPTKFTHKIWLFSLVVAAVISILALAPLPWNPVIEEQVITWQFQLRGQRDLSDEFVLVYIAQEDIEALGGWPLTRDYYGYAAHILHELSARCIGFYLLLNTPDSRFPEYDALLGDFFRREDNVCLPFAFQTIETRANQAVLPAGRDPVLPLPVFADAAALIGYSNLGQGGRLLKVPVQLISGDTTVASFGVQVAQLSTRRSGKNGILAVPAGGTLWLNHFGDQTRISSISFLGLLQTFETAPDSLHLEDKIVLIDVTAPGIPTLVATPYSKAMPTSLIHATVAENLLHGLALRPTSSVADIVLIILMSGLAALIFSFRKNSLFSVLWPAVPVLFWVLCLVAFVKFNTIVPVFYPTLAFVASSGFLLLLHKRQTDEASQSRQRLLEQEIARKERHIAEFRYQLEARESALKRETRLTEAERSRADENQATLLELEKQLEDLKSYAKQDPAPVVAAFPDVICSEKSSLMHVLELVRKVSSDDIPVLLLGQTGTGKELIAQTIHRSSKRCRGPFVALNCGALPETLLDSELFGHEKGSFTGADRRRKGRFEQAHGGTLFLDEITETTPAFQARLLRVLQSGVFERLGGEASVTVNVRVIAATNRDIDALVRRREFREDLYFRLNGFRIHLPRLAERRDDIPLLAGHILKKYGYTSIEGISESAVKALQEYLWPGNVRELENAIRRAAILAQSAARSLIQLDDLADELKRGGSHEPVVPSYLPLEEQILDSLRKLRFSRSSIQETAKALGNRDRGTITEYFRGICFQALVEHNFDLRVAAKFVAGPEEDVSHLVEVKIQNYLDNLRPLPDDLPADSTAVSDLPPQFKGLPKKFHPFLNEVIHHLRVKPTID